MIEEAPRPAGVVGYGVGCRLYRDRADSEPKQSRAGAKLRPNPQSEARNDD